MKSKGENLFTVGFGDNALSDVLLLALLNICCFYMHSINKMSWFPGFALCFVSSYIKEVLLTYAEY